MTKKKYFPVELHTHTYHSDAIFTEKELLDAARDFGYEALFVTDHNTNSPLDTIYDEGLDKEIIKTYPGSEWTTFYGHMVILGNREMGDYTKARMDNIEECIDEIRAREGDIALGIAHPFDIGNPICTGCHWDFEVSNYNQFDYLELVNGENTEDSLANDLAYKKWISLLGEGYKLAALAGRDWHGPSRDDVVVAINMLGVDGDLDEKACLQAIKNQHTYISYGLIFDLDMGGINLGDSITSGREYEGSITLSEGSFINFSQLSLRPEILKIYNNEEVIYEAGISLYECVYFAIIPKKGYLRFEVVGAMKEKATYKLIISSPIYVD